MAVGAMGAARAAYRPQVRGSAAGGTTARTEAAATDTQAQPGPDGVVRSEAAKEGYKAWLKGRMKAMFEEIIATATKRHS